MTHFRYVEPPIIWVRRIAPMGGQSARPGTPKACGLLFEKTIGDVLAPLGAEPNQWLNFKDSGGARCCQIDFLIAEPQLVIVECKLNHYTYTKSQLLRFYAPVVEFLFNRKPICLVALEGRRQNIVSFGRAVREAQQSADLFGVW